MFQGVGVFIFETFKAHNFILSNFHGSVKIAQIAPLKFLKLWTPTYPREYFEDRAERKKKDTCSRDDLITLF